MARTFGGASTDKITTAFTTHSTQRTWSVWLYRTGTGGGGLGRVFDKRTSSGQTEVLAFIGGYEFDRNFSGGQGSWKINDPAGTSVWFNLVVTYDSSATTNDPIFYYNGVSQSLSLDSNPASGTPNTSTDPYVLGNRGNDNARNWAGDICEFAVWDRILDQSEITALANGFSPAFFKNSLVEYVPLLREITSAKNAIPTASGTVVSNHPRIIYQTNFQSLFQQSGGTSYNIIAATGSFTETGSDAVLSHGTNISPEFGSFTITGQDAGLSHSVTLNSETGTFVLTGQDAVLSTQYVVITETGGFLLTGQDAALTFSQIMSAETGAYTLTGNDAALPIDYKINPETGTFTLTGNNVNLGFSSPSGAGNIIIGIAL